MVLGSAALKAAAVVAVLAVLVLPSSGSYWSPWQAPPGAAPVATEPPPPSATPGPAPPPNYSWQTPESAPPAMAPVPAWGPSLEPVSPPADAPVPAPASGPAFGPTAPEPAHQFCSDCAFRCAGTCSVHPADCIEFCSPGPGPYCDPCRSTALQRCRDRCSGSGGCSGMSGDYCDTEAESSCYGPCHVVQSAACTSCQQEVAELCDSCNSDCAATCISA